MDIMETKNIDTKKLVVIYKIISPSNKIYIGQSRDWASRKSKYKNLKCEEQIKIYRSLIKYGYENHKIEILECFTRDITQEELNNKEIYYWKYFKELGFNMLNVRFPGSNGLASEETRKKQSLALSGKNNPMFGKFGKDHPAYGNIGFWKGKPKELHPRFGSTGEKNPNYGRTGEKHPMFGIKRGKHQSAKKVINLNTQEIFDCAKDAAEKYNINYSFLTAKLRKNIDNKYFLKYLNN